MEKQKFDLEGFKPLKGYEDYYLINKEGQIYSLKKYRLVARNARNGYYRVFLYKEKQKNVFSIGALLLENFVEPRPSKGYVCDYKDDNGFNLELNNLQWISRKKLIDLNKEKAKKQAQKETGLTGYQVANICEIYEYSFASYDDIAKLYSVTPEVIEEIINKRGIERSAFLFG